MRRQFLLRWWQFSCIGCSRTWAWHASPLPAVVACALGSDMWSVASQSLWQHGPAALALTLAILLLRPPAVSRTRMLAAGWATAAMVAVRSLDVVFALAIVCWLLCRRPRHIGWFLPGPVILGLALVAYNLWYFGAVTGGQDQLEQLHREFHGVGGPWSGNLWAGMAGTLFSPNRGLFVFSPWVLISLLVCPAAVKRLPRGSLIPWMLLALILFLLLLSKYAVWWAGGCFGPRYWTEVFPLFAILLACGLQWGRERSPAHASPCSGRRSCLRSPSMPSAPTAFRAPGISIQPTSTSITSGSGTGATARYHAVSVKPSEHPFPFVFQADEFCQLIAPMPRSARSRSRLRHSGFTPDA